MIRPPKSECVLAQQKLKDNQKWEQRRYELAKDAMTAILSNHQWCKHSQEGCYKKTYVAYADTIIKNIEGRLI